MPAEACSGTGDDRQEEEPSPKRQAVAVPSDPALASQMQQMNEMMNFLRESVAVVIANQSEDKRKLAAIEEKMVRHDDLLRELEGRIATVTNTGSGIDQTSRNQCCALEKKIKAEIKKLSGRIGASASVSSSSIASSPSSLSVPALDNIMVLGGIGTHVPEEEALRFARDFAHHAGLNFEPAHTSAYKMTSQVQYKFPSREEARQAVDTFRALPAEVRRFRSRELYATIRQRKERRARNRRLLRAAASSPKLQQARVRPGQGGFPAGLLAIYNGLPRPTCGSSAEDRQQLRVGSQLVQLRGLQLQRHRGKHPRGRGEHRVTDYVVGAPSAFWRHVGVDVECSDEVAGTASGVTGFNDTPSSLGHPMSADRGGRQSRLHTARGCHLRSSRPRALQVGCDVFVRSCAEAATRPPILPSQRRRRS